MISGGGSLKFFLEKYTIATKAFEHFDESDTVYAVNRTDTSGDETAKLPSDRTSTLNSGMKQYMAISRHFSFISVLVGIQTK